MHQVFRLPRSALEVLEYQAGKFVADLVNIEEMMFDISFAGYGSLYFKRVFLVSYE
jgi:hypothetical protein